MANNTNDAKSPRMSDAAVKAKTGKSWKEWFAILDKAGASKMNHQEIVEYLNTKQGLGPWWQQMVTVTYEQARGLREQHQKPDGYEISISRTVKVPITRLFKAVVNEKARLAWLPEKTLALRKAMPNKSIRFAWIDGQSSFEVSFLSKTDDKTQVVVQHRKLPNAKASAKMKAYWAKALDRLRGSLEE